MKTYFHSAPLPLAPGSIILPGNWGRVLNLYNRQGFGNAWLLAREMTFETIRCAEFPALPSRLSAAFAFESLDAANEHFIAATPSNFLYRVELLDANAASHRGCMKLVDVPAEHEAFLPECVRRARAFWGAGTIETPEIVTLSRLRVVELVNGAAAGYAPVSL